MLLHSFPDADARVQAVDPGSAWQRNKSCLSQFPSRAEYEPAAQLPSLRQSLPIGYPPPIFTPFDRVILATVRCGQMCSAQHLVIPGVGSVGVAIGGHAERRTARLSSYPTLAAPPKSHRRGQQSHRRGRPRFPPRAGARLARTADGELRRKRRTRRAGRGIPLRSAQGPEMNN